MSARRRRTAAVTTTVASLGLAPLALTVLAAGPASAHGTMGDPVSRVFQCYGENPESPTSAACKAAVATGGTQALYDWNGVRIGDVAGQHQARIPDGELCSAGNDEFKGLDLARADWPATSVSSGSYTFKYRVTAQHKGTFTVYLTKAGYAPTQPLAWSDLDLSSPVATVTDPVAADGYYTFSGTLPQRTGRQLLYAVWQRSDSPEAFYSCSDVDFGGSTSSGTASGTTSGTATGSDDTGSGDTAASGADTDSGSGDDSGSEASAAPAASAPSEEQIAAGADKSTVGHTGHGGHTATKSPASADALSAQGGSENLAETGGDGRTTAWLAVGGAAVVAFGSTTLLLSARRRHRH